MKKVVSIGLAIVFVAAIAYYGIAFYSDGDCCYTQIDNSKVEEIKSNGGVIDFSGGMKYSYELVAYNEKGKEKSVEFGTEKKLKEGAFLCLTVKAVQGVVDWKEVQYDELPTEVQNNYTAPQK
ncbi:MAG: YxeA family protein [Eubacterium sp.]|nr:YxeA family protein [Eubacterium sp.]